MTLNSLDTAYLNFITQVVPLLKDMSSDDITDLLSDITSKMKREIEGAKESELYRDARLEINKEESDFERMQMLRDDSEEEPVENDSEDTMEI